MISIIQFPLTSATHRSVATAGSSFGNVVSGLTARWTTGLRYRQMEIAPNLTLPRRPASGIAGRIDMLRRRLTCGWRRTPDRCPQAKPPSAFERPAAREARASDPSDEDALADDALVDDARAKNALADDALAERVLCTTLLAAHGVEFALPCLSEAADLLARVQRSGRQQSQAPCWSSPASHQERLIFCR